MTVVALAVALFISGQPAQIKCDVASNLMVEAYVVHDGSQTIHMTQSLCDGLGARPSDPRFSYALGVLIHESSHLRGVRSEPCAELYAAVMVYEVLERFYRVPMFTSLSWDTGSRVQAANANRPQTYHYTSTACDDEP